VTKSSRNYATPNNDLFHAETHQRSEAPLGALDAEKIKRSIMADE